MPTRESVSRHDLIVCACGEQEYTARDGIDAARELFGELDIRCIFATAHDDPRTRERAEPYAPLGWLAKPYTMASLVTLVIAARSKLD